MTVESRERLLHSSLRYLNIRTDTRTHSLAMRLAIDVATSSHLHCCTSGKFNSSLCVRVYGDREAASGAERGSGLAGRTGFPLRSFLKSGDFQSSFPGWAYGKIFYNHKQYRRHPTKKGVHVTLDSKSIVSRSNAETDDFVPPGCTRIKVELNKPLGIVLEEDKAGRIFVAEVVKDGNAYKSGLVDVGDQLIATSALVYGTEEFYQGVKVRKGMQIVRLSAFGEKFETVMAAIGTHPAHVKVALEIQKCRRPGGREQNNGAAN